MSNSKSAMDLLPDSIRRHVMTAHKVGSRVTCNPAPVDTDQDVLLLIDKEAYTELSCLLLGEDFEHDGSDVKDPLESSDTFQSFSLGELNLIITGDIYFFERFLAASSIARRLNLLDKADRIALFQAVLYANADIEHDISL